MHGNILKNIKPHFVTLLLMTFPIVPLFTERVLLDTRIFGMTACICKLIGLYEKDLHQPRFQTLSQSNNYIKVV